MSTEEYSWHAIAVGNSVLGVYNFIVLAAPPDWRVVIMPMASDVFSHMTKDGVKWVRDGEIKHFIKAGRRFYELEVKAKPGNKLNGLRSWSQTAEVGGHRAYVRVKEEGLFKKKKALEVWTYCDETDRTIIVSLKGDEVPEELLRYIGHSKCH
ncbi:MAG: hypothetical protein ABWJ97_04500 [Thermoproteus sp.]